MTENRVHSVLHLCHMRCVLCAAGVNTCRYSLNFWLSAWPVPALPVYPAGLGSNVLSLSFGRVLPACLKPCRTSFRLRPC